MGSSSKKKQRRKKEFQKVKLKVGKKIAKGNVVDTTFKTRKIQIPNQQKVHGDKQSGSVRTNIEEMCKQLQTQNPHRRTDALRSIKDSLLAIPDALLSKLYLLVPQLAATLTDESFEVRRDALPVLRHVFARVPYARAQPFLPTLSAHLRCAINHLSQDVQHDSLPFLDLLVELYPEYVGRHSKALIDDFLKLISKPRQSADGALSTTNFQPTQANCDDINTSGVSSFVESSSSFGVTLSSDPSRRLTSTTWHLRVAQRMQKILAALLDNSKNCGSSGSLSNRRPFHSSLQPGLRPDSSVSDNQLETFFESAEHMQDFYSKIMPLLFEMWVEAGTIAANVPHKNAPLCDKMQFYSCIVVVIKTLLELLDKWVEADKGQKATKLHSWFITAFGRPFLSHCMGGFPYSDMNQQRKAKDVQPPIVQKPMTAMKINLYLCDITTSMFFADPRANDDCLASVVAFVRNVLVFDTRRQTNPENVELALGVVHRLLCMPDLHEVTKEVMLDCFLVTFQRTPAGSKVHQFYLSTLSDVVLTKNYNIFRKGLIDAWIGRFADDLLKCDVVSWDSLQIIKKMGSLCHMEFLLKMQELYPDLLERLPSLSLEPGRSHFEAKKIILNYIYWLPSLDKSVMSILVRLCVDQMLDLSSCSYVLDLLTVRCLHDLPDAPYQKICDGYLSFVLSVTLGCSADFLKESQNLDEDCELLEIRFQNQFEFVPDSAEDLKFFSSFTKMGIEKLNLAISSGLPSSLIAAFLNDLLSGYRIFPLRCLHSILAIVSRVWKGCSVPANIILALVNMSMAFLELGTKDEPQSSKNSDFQAIVAGLLHVEGLAGPIVKRLVTVGYGELSSESRPLLENMICSVMKECREDQTKSLEKVLNDIQVEIMG